MNDGIAICHGHGRFLCSVGYGHLCGEDDMPRSLADRLKDAKRDYDKETMRLQVATIMEHMSVEQLRALIDVAKRIQHQ